MSHSRHRRKFIICNSLGLSLVSLPSERKQRTILGSLSSLGRLIGRIQTTIDGNPLLLALIAVNVLLIFLPFYDTNNIPLDISFVSHFGSSSPAFGFTNWPGGPFINALWVPGYFAYLFSGFSLYWTYTTFKVINFFFTIVLAYSLWYGSHSLDRNLAKQLAFFTIGNPALLFVNYIWVEYDIIPIAFLALSYVLLRNSGKNLKPWRAIILSSIALTISVFFYWFALAAIPTILYFSKGNRIRLRFICSLLLAGIPTLYVTVWLMGGGPQHYLSAFVGANPALNRSATFGFQYFFPLSSIMYLSLVAGFVFIIPIILKYAGISEAGVLFIVLILLVFTSPVPTPDNYLFVYPFAVVSVVPPLTHSFKHRRLWASLVYPFCGLLLINFYIGNAQPDGIGIFYWGYDLFHANVHYLVNQDSVSLFLRFYNLVTSAAVISSIGLIVATSREPVTTAGFEAIGVRVVSDRRIHSLIFRKHAKSYSTSLLVLVIVLFITVPVSIATNNGLPNAIRYNGSGSAPIYIFLPLFLPDNGNVVRPIPNATFSLHGPVVEISSLAPPFSFTRWFKGQALDIQFRETLYGQVPRNLSILNGTPFSVSLTNLSANISRIAGNSMQFTTDSTHGNNSDFRLTSASSENRNLYSSFESEVTPLNGALSNSTNVSTWLVHIYDGKNTSLTSLSTSTIEIALNSASMGTTLNINGHNFHSKSITTIISIGKLFKGNYGINMTWMHVSISQISPDRFFVIPVFWTMICPYLFLYIVAETNVEQTSRWHD